MKNNGYAILMLLIFCQKAVAQDYVWIIGGGPSLMRSQGQIELNTQWIQKIIRNQRPDAKVKVYYTDGYQTESDVKIWQKPAESLEKLQPLARVFDFHIENGDHYRNHQVDAVVAGTDPEHLLAGMKNDFAKLTANDQVFFIYQGHGADDEDDISKNSLSLWGKNGQKRLTVGQLARLFNRLPATVPVRFMFPQCYAGGFAQLIYPNAQTGAQLTEGLRCGFMAESAYSPAEGCSSSVESGDYRDYSTYFFAALNQRTRLNQPLAVNPDRNHDGVVSLNEAHYYSLSQAESADLPRSTSEVYLEQWQPWYLRWLNHDTPPDNIYSTLANEIAQHYHFSQTDNALVTALAQRYQEWRTKQDQLLEKQTEIQEQSLQLSFDIREQVLRKWPNAIYPYTKNFYDFLQHDLTATQKFIVLQADYPRLVKLQDQDWAMNEKLLALERKITQIKKIQRLRHLAIILDQFNRYANAQQKAHYQQLLRCENAVM